MINTVGFVLYILHRIQFDCLMKLGKIKAHHNVAVDYV